MTSRAASVSGPEDMSALPGAVESPEQNEALQAQPHPEPGASPERN